MHLLESKSIQQGYTVLLLLHYFTRAHTHTPDEVPRSEIHLSATHFLYSQPHIFRWYYHILYVRIMAMQTME